MHVAGLPRQMGAPRFRAPCRLAPALLLALAFAALPQPGRADPIGDLVAQVSADSLASTIAALDYPRYGEANLDRASDWIDARLTAYGYSVTHQPVYNSGNVIARLHGVTDPGQIFVIGAHFDTVAGSPGADDNSSGVAGLLELARVLAPTRPPFSIEFVAFAFEEQWMIGSGVYVEQAQQQGENLIGMICFDMIGYTCATPGCQPPIYNGTGCLTVDPQGGTVGDYVATLVNVASAPLLAACDYAGATYVPELPRVRLRVLGTGGCDPFTRRSDHVPFWDAGIPAIEFFNTYGARNPFYHTPLDQPATLDLPFCQAITRTALAMVLQASVAGAPGWPAPARPAALLAVCPNPAPSDVRIRLDQPEGAPGGAVRLTVHDAAGRLVRSLGDGSPARGGAEVVWNRRDDAGRPVSSGVYLVRLENAGETAVGRVVVTR